MKKPNDSIVIGWAETQEELADDERESVQDLNSQTHGEGETAQREDAQSVPRRDG